MTAETDDCAATVSDQLPQDLAGIQPGRERPLMPRSRKVDLVVFELAIVPVGQGLTWVSIFAIGCGWAVPDPGAG
jgi:hypothetical protein